MDLNLRDNADPVTGYVAMSRFKRAEDVLILQPFDLEVFQQGIADQPRLLLERLRNLKKDMSAILEEHRASEQKKAEEKKRKRAETARAARVQAADTTNDNMTEESNKRRAGEA